MKFLSQSQKKKNTLVGLVKYLEMIPIFILVRLNEMVDLFMS
jgi:hypothetical protein